jgi:hypothetical protein
MIMSPPEAGGPEEFSLRWRQERQNCCRTAAIRLPVPLPA